MRVTKWRQNDDFWLNCPFKRQDRIVILMSEFEFMDKGGKRERWMQSETRRRLIDGQQEADAVADSDQL